MTHPHHLVVGPDRHGVTRYAQQHADAACARCGASHTTRHPERLRRDTVDDVLRRLPPSGPVHAHVTDHLFGRSPEEAAEVVARLARGRRLTVTLHDLPQASDGPVAPRRARSYAEVARTCHGVIVSSDHERRLLEVALSEHPGGPVRTAVVPHAVTRTGATASPTRPTTRRAPAASSDVVVLGFVYPGKGHAESLAALAGLPPDVGLLALGRASEGHADVVDGLHAQARAAGRRLTVSGWLDDDALTVELHRAAVPLAPHRHVSASGSIATWVGAGRRPLVTRSAYTEELDARSPGTVTLVDDLPAALRRALDHPESTWVAAGVDVGPSEATVADLCDEVLASW